MVAPCGPRALVFYKLLLFYCICPVISSSFLANECLIVCGLACRWPESPGDVSVTELTQFIFLAFLAFIVFHTQKEFF